MKIGYEGIRIFKRARKIKLQVEHDTDNPVIFYDSSKENILGSNEIEIQTEKSKKMFRLSHVPIDAFERQLLMGIPIKEHVEKVLTSLSGIEKDASSFVGTKLLKFKIIIEDNFFICTEFKIERTWRIFKPKEVGTIRTFFQGIFDPELQYDLEQLHTFNWSNAKLLSDIREVVI